jgi:hypothetical protein
MLTMKQMFKASGMQSGADLLGFFGVHPLSVRSVISSYSQQRQAYAVKLISPNILLSDQVNSFSDFQRLQDGPLGQMSQSEVTDLAAYLEGIGIYLRYVNKDLRRAVLIGDVPSLANAPAAPINDGNFITIKDASSGATKVGTGVIAGGTVIIGTVAAGPAAAAAGAEGVLFLGAAVVAFGVGFLISWGVLEIIYDSPPQPQKPSSDNTNVPNETDDGEDGDVDVPSAVAFGTPENGIDPEQLVNELATGTLDEILSSLPIGWDSDSGTSLPGIGDFGGDDSGDGSGLGSGLGFG